MSISVNSNTWSSAAANNADMATSAALTASGVSPSLAAPPPSGDIQFGELNTKTYILIIVSVIIIIYYALFSTLGMNVNLGSTTTLIIEFLLWGTFIVLVLLNGISYIFNIDILQSLKNLWSGNPTVKINVARNDLDDKRSTVREQVFHIADNKYGYEDAKAICAAYGSRLASIKELDDAYNTGADFCSYGWSDGQMALYPTQYDKWEKLQKIEGHEHDCGRPGINGGYISNPAVRFGVNCFGVKRPITQEEADAMRNTSLYPKTQKESQFDKRVDYWRNNMTDLALSPFSQTQWSA